MEPLLFLSSHKKEMVRHRMRRRNPDQIHVELGLCTSPLGQIQDSVNSSSPATTLGMGRGLRPGKAK